MSQRVDQRSPFVLDTHELARTAGAQRELQFTVPAPADLGTAVIGVPEGDPIEFDLRLESVVEGIFVSGTASGRLEGECVRCLDPVTEEFLVDLGELYCYDDRPDPDAVDDDGRTSRMDGDLIDLEPILRDQVVSALPFQPLCGPDCPGLCPDCGARLADDPDHHHEQLDPRWAKLGALEGLQARSDESPPHTSH